MFLKGFLPGIGPPSRLALTVFWLRLILGQAIVPLLGDVLGCSPVRLESGIHPLPAVEHEGLAELDDFDRVAVTTVRSPHSDGAERQLVHGATHHVGPAHQMEAGVLVELVGLGLVLPLPGHQLFTPACHGCVVLNSFLSSLFGVRTEGGVVGGHPPPHPVVLDPSQLFLPLAVGENWIFRFEGLWTVDPGQICGRVNPVPFDEQPDVARHRAVDPV